LGWRIEFHPGPERELSKLDREVARRIVLFFGRGWLGWKIRAPWGHHYEVRSRAASGGIGWETTGSSPTFRTHIV